MIRITHKLGVFFCPEIKILDRRILFMDIHDSIKIRIDFNCENELKDFVNSIELEPKDRIDLIKLLNLKKHKSVYNKVENKNID